MAYSIDLHWSGLLGPNARAQVAPQCVARGWRLLWVVLDRGVAEAPMVTGLLHSWRAAGLAVHASVRPEGEPTYDHLEELRRSAPAETPDVIVGLGGGSTIDTAKGLAVLTTNAGPALSYRGFEKFPVAPRPNIAIPTIAGSGAEVTPNASFVDLAARKKLGINGAAIRPTLSVLDPELTAEAPVAATLATGFDALVHSIEAFSSCRSTPVARELARGAVRLVSRSLVAVREGRATDEVRQDLLVGAGFAAHAMANSGTGPAAALSYPAGVWLGLSHGLAGAAFLPEVVALNVSRGVLAYSELLPFLPLLDSAFAPDASTPAAGAATFATRLARLRDALGLRPPGGLIRDDAVLDALCGDLRELQGALESNAVPFTVDDGRRLYTDVLGTGAAPHV